MNQLSLLLPTAGETQLAHVVKYLADHPIKDAVLKAEDIRFVAADVPPSGTTVKLHVAREGGLSIHPHAMGQICSRVRLSRPYASGLLGEDTYWANNLLVTNLNTLFENRGDGRSFLVRSVDKQVRGFLSNAYKCLDSITLIDEFASCARAVRAVPHSAFVTPLRVAVQAVLPDVWKVNDVPTRAGVILRNSEFGAGHAEVHFFISMWGRTMIGRRGVKKPHRGRRLGQDLSFNERIKEANSALAAAQMKDHVFLHLEPSNIQAVMAEVELSANASVTADQVSDILQNLELDDTELKKALDAFKQERSDLPKGFTMFKLANALAWIAEQEPDPERKLELMGMAGDLIMS